MVQRSRRLKSAPQSPTTVMVRAAADNPVVLPQNTPAAGEATSNVDLFKLVYNLYTAMKTNGERYKPLWNKISKSTGINVDPDYIWNNQGNKAIQLDECVDDPTSAVSVNQAGDYLVGIMWETGENVFRLKPSRYVAQLADPATLQEYYTYATDQSLYHINHPETGFIACLQPYAYDQFAFGNSGVGLFKNQAFLRGVDNNCMVARQYGIDNTRIKEGKSGNCDYGSALYHWSVTRIVGEFCMSGGVVSSVKLEELPDPIKKAYNAGDINLEFDIVFLWMPREDYDPRRQGKLGYKYAGYWFMDIGNAANRIFCEESFRKRPINFTRMIKVRGEDYGRSSGTLLLSTIQSVNYAFAITQEILEKMADPALGMFGNAIMGDNVLDTTSGGLTIFNQALMGDGKSPPMFQLHDVGDPSEIIKWFIPYLNDKITSAFKIDALLDFNSDHEMSATESLQRYNIRGKSLAGILIRQKNELLIPSVDRAVSICWECGELGVNEKKLPQKAQHLKSINQAQQIIPQAILDCVAAGKPWYEIEFNNELEKLLKTQKIQALVQLIQFVTAVAALYPDIIHAIDWYQLLVTFNDNLDVDQQIVISAKKFKETIAQAAQAKAQAAQSQLAQQNAGALKDGASAQESLANAGAVRNGQTQSAGLTA